MFAKLRWIAAISGALLPVAASADFNFNNITNSDFDRIVNEFSAVSTYSLATPASSLGGLWGFEFGLVAATSKAPDTQALVAAASPSTSFTSLYNAGAIFRLGLPFGVTAEALYVPKIKIGNGHLNRWGLGAQWTLTDSLLEDLPVNIAVKASYSKTSLDYSQNIQNASTANQPVAATINLDDSAWTIGSLLSYKILVFEPYVGLGYTKAKGTLSVNANGTATIFAPGFGNVSSAVGFAQSADSKPTSSVLTAGLDLRLSFFSLGAEYDHVFGKNTMLARLSFRF